MERKRIILTGAVMLAAFGINNGSVFAAAIPSPKSVGSAVQQGVQQGVQGAQGAAAGLGNAVVGAAQSAGQTVTNAAGAAADIAGMAAEQAERTFNCAKALPDCAVDVYNDVKNSLPNVTPADIQAAMTKVAILGGTVTDNTGKPLPGVPVQVTGGTVQGDVSDACKAVLAMAARGTVAAAQVNVGSIKAGFVIDTFSAGSLTGPDGAYRIPVPACASIQYTLMPTGAVAEFFSWAPGNREVTVASGGPSAQQNSGASAGQAASGTAAPKVTRSASSPSRPVRAGSAQPASQQQPVSGPVQKAPAPVLGGQTLKPVK